MRTTRAMVGVAVLVLAGAFGCGSNVAGGQRAGGGGGQGGEGGDVGEGCNGGSDCVPCSPSSEGEPCDVEGFSCVVGHGNCDYLHVCKEHVWVFEYNSPGPMMCP